MVSAVFGSLGSTADASRFVSSKNAARVYGPVSRSSFSSPTQHTPVNRDLVIAI